MSTIGRSGGAYGISLGVVSHEDTKPRSHPAFLVLRVVQPALQYAVPDDVDAAGQAELSHGVRLVHLDRFDADGQAVGDLFVAVPDGDEPKHFRLALSDCG